MTTTNCRMLWHAAIALTALTIAACGGSGTGASAGTNANSTACVPDNPATADACGSVVVALTDAEGEFASYTVDVLSISLERRDGSAIEVLPQTARIDFAQLTSLSELLSVGTVVPGEFTGGRIRIDYSDADIYVEAGGEIVPAQLFDSSGYELTAGGDAGIVDVAISLPDRDPLTVTRGGVAFMSIDFDLAASHIVDTTTSPVTAVARPFLAAETRPIDQKEFRVRGTLIDVDTDAGTYDIRLRPWYDRLGSFGVLTVNTDDTTRFEINGSGFTGTAGLRALADQPEGTLTVAYGTLDLSDRSFDAEIVHAGDSVGGDRFSAVLGNIVSRAGDRLILKGALAILNDRRARFQRTIVVDVGPDTAVTKIRYPDADLDKDDLSIGQRVIIFGEFTNPAADSLVLDATAGRARMLVTRLTGTLTQAYPGQIDMRLRAIDRLSATLFDFTGTGAAPVFDADPMNYEIATATLPLDQLMIDEPVRVLGFVTGFGEAPPDFEGRALVGPRDLPATLGVGWGVNGTDAPFSVMGPTSLVIDLENPDIDVRHHILVGDRLIDLFKLPASPGIEGSEPPGIYGVWEPGHIELFRDFAEFVDELSLRLSNTDRARSLAAYGAYSPGESLLTARKIVVHMLPAD